VPRNQLGFDGPVRYEDSRSAFDFVGSRTNGMDAPAHPRHQMCQSSGVTRLVVRKNSILVSGVASGCNYGMIAAW
jgi:hypothetical protein